MQAAITWTLVITCAGSHTYYLRFRLDRGVGFETSRFLFISINGDGESFHTVTSQSPRVRTYILPIISKLTHLATLILRPCQMAVLNVMIRSSRFTNLFYVPSHSFFWRHSLETGRYVQEMRISFLISTNVESSGVSRRSDKPKGGWCVRCRSNASIHVHIWIRC